MAHRPPSVGPMNPLPKEFGSALHSRRNALASAARGRVLDLGGWSDHLGSYQIGTEVVSVTMLGSLGGDRAAGHDPRGVVRIDASPEQLADGGYGTFDTIVSLIRTPLVADFDRFLRTLILLLADEATLLFLEPVKRPGRTGRTRRTGRLLSAAGRLGSAFRHSSTVKGLYVDRDLPAAIRAGGLTVTDLWRFDVPNLSPPLRPFMEARARLPLKTLGSLRS